MFSQKIVGSVCKLAVLTAVSSSRRLHASFVSSLRSFSSNGEYFDPILHHQGDKYDGILVDADHLPSDAQVFTQTLKSSLSAWTIAQRRAVWLKVPIEKSQLIEPAVRQGFIFHHAEKDYVTMTHWLGAPEENRIPISASHQVGVGCVVLNSKNELLLVQERSGFTRGMNLWKYPTGLLDLGEDIHAGAAREVFEETGIRTKFNSMLAFRQTHNAIFGKSDLFFICLMDLVDEASAVIAMQKAELVACDWKAPEVYFNQPFIQRSGVHTTVGGIVRQIIKSRVEGSSGSGSESAVPLIGMKSLPAGYKPGNADLYFVNT